MFFFEALFLFIFSEQEKVKKAKTDAEAIPSEVEGLKNRHEAANLISIYASLNNIKVEKVLKEFGGKNFSLFKNKLSESVIEKICPIGIEIKIMPHQNFIFENLLGGAGGIDLGFSIL